MLIPIQTRETLKAANPLYFKQISQRQPGTAHTVCSRPRPSFTLKSSYFVVRRGHRKAMPNTYYRATLYDYAIALVRWTDGAITELATFATLKEARQAMVTYR